MAPASTPNVHVPADRAPARRRPARRRWLAVAASAVVSIAAACSGNDDDTADDTNDAGETSGLDASGDTNEDPGEDTAPSGTADPDDEDPTSDGDAATPGPTSDATAEDALEFFRSTEEACRTWADDTGNPVVDPDRFADAEVESEIEDGLFVVTDGEGTRLQVDLIAESVFGTDGPEGIMPNPYAFGCPAGLYVGTLAE